MVQRSPTRGGLRDRDHARELTACVHIHRVRAAWRFCPQPAQMLVGGPTLDPDLRSRALRSYEKGAGNEFVRKVEV